MKINTDLNINSLHKYWSGFIAITGYKKWIDRVNLLEKQLEENPMLRESYITNHSLEFMVVKVHQRWTKYRKFPKINDELLYRTFSFVAITSQVYERLSEKGKKRLRGNFLSALNDDYGFHSLRYEMVMACNFFSKGFDVEFHDIEKEGFDFLISKEDIVAEVECKTATADIGRKIHRKQMAKFRNEIYPFSEDFLAKSEHGVFINIILNQRLYKDDNFQLRIVNSVKKLITQNVTEIKTDDYTMTKQYFDIKNTPFSRTDIQPTQEELSSFISSRFDKSDDHIFINFSLNQSAFLIVIESVKPDEVQTGIYKQMKSAAKKQLTGTHPGIVCVYLTDLSESQLYELWEQHDGDAEQPSGLRIISSRFLNSNERSHIHTIAYYTSGKFDTRNTLSHDKITTYYRSMGPVYMFQNKNNSFYDNEVLKQIFLD